MESVSAWAERVWRHARELGLDPAPTDFYVVPRETLWALAAYGVPHHPGHWRYGRDYWVLREQQVNGQGHLYEMVIRAEPVTAYLDAANSFSDQQLVIAHVAGHADLFQNHLLYRQQRPDWPAVLDAARNRWAEYRDRYGDRAVEQVWSDALALEDQVAEEDLAVEEPPPDRDPFADLWPGRGTPFRRPPDRYRLPTADVLGFIARYSPTLDDWQRDCLWLVRGTALYFWPQRLTKLVQEGYATWVQHRIMQDLDWAPGSRVQAAISSAAIEWASDLVVNPYDLGARLFAWLEARRGWEAVVEIARRVTDGELIARYVTEEAVRDLELYRYRWEEGGTEWDAVREAADWRAVRDAWNNQVVERPPRVSVSAVSGEGRLTLAWDDPVPPDIAEARRTLAAVRRLWGAPVRLEWAGGPPVLPEEG